MCLELGVDAAEDIVRQTVPESIYNSKLTIQERGMSEQEALHALADCFKGQESYRNYYGLGYYPALTPPALQRYLFENPGWYTPYTPYQAEISQGRLEILFYFQTLVCELTGLPLANASLLDEGTAAAEAMSLSFAKRTHQSTHYLVASTTLPQTLAVLASRARSLGITIELWDMATYHQGTLAPLLQEKPVFGALLAHPDSRGQVWDLTDITRDIHQAGGIVACATDLLALTIMKSPAKMGVDIAFGSAQRLGVPMGYGGPHAAFFACSMDYLRRLPGRVVGRSKDRSGTDVFRLALQTREQHIKREKATSNICTAQALLASMAAGYAVYHGREGLVALAKQLYRRTAVMAELLKSEGFTFDHDDHFDTLSYRFPSEKHYQGAVRRAAEKKINLVFPAEAGGYGQFSVCEAATTEDLADVFEVLTGSRGALPHGFDNPSLGSEIAGSVVRDDESFLRQEIFQKPPSELEFMRWLKRLENKDLSLTHSMIPLGSCTMKLNAAAELAPLSWPQLQNTHPLQPEDQVSGYQNMIAKLGQLLAQLTGLDAVSFQPNSGAQGELAGLMTIMSYLKSRHQEHRRVCFVPASAHGTNPASSVMAGMRVVVIKSDHEGNIDLEALKTKIAEHKQNLACLMVTYPSTHGVFEQNIRQICDLVHEAGGQVYLDGANLNAQLGVCLPGEYGIDVCHMNLHKTFCIPHGGGGPGAGPIAVAKHLTDHLPTHPYKLGRLFLATGDLGEEFSVSSAHHGSPSILAISWMYIHLMGASGLREASRVAILSANYVAKRLSSHYPILFTGKGGWVAHECLLDFRQIQKSTGITVEDVAKRLMDFGFHAPTMSFPIAGTLMIEPTESESLEEINRFIEAMIVIREEIAAVESGDISRSNSPLKGAPHPWWSFVEEWKAPYSIKQACFPLPWLKDRKFWPTTQRIDNALGDRQFICSCDPVESYEH